MQAAGTVALVTRDGQLRIFRISPSRVTLNAGNSRPPPSVGGVARAVRHPERAVPHAGCGFRFVEAAASDPLPRCLPRARRPGPGPRPRLRAARRPSTAQTACAIIGRSGPSLLRASRVPAKLRCISHWPSAASLPRRAAKSLRLWKVVRRRRSEILVRTRNRRRGALRMRRGRGVDHGLEDGNGGRQVTHDEACSKHRWAR